MTYRNLDSEKITHTLFVLNKRIRHRFPGSGLSKVSSELLIIGQEAKFRTRWISRPNVELRFIVGFVILIMVMGLCMTFKVFHVITQGMVLSEFIQAMEAGINNLVLIGAAVIFLVTMETRIKRSRTLGLMHQLRVMAHVIDMHQLTKDPEWVLSSLGQSTSIIRPKMTPFELNRYLDYCSELLSLIGKIAALYVQDFRDSVAVTAVNEIESLTTNLSRKIWQKIMILHSYKVKARVK